jgi:hypothetical protein
MHACCGREVICEYHTVVQFHHCLHTVGGGSKIPTFMCIYLMAPVSSYIVVQLAQYCMELIMFHVVDAKLSLQYLKKLTSTLSKFTDGPFTGKLSKSKS